MTRPRAERSDREAPLLDLQFSPTRARMTHDRLNVMHAMHDSVTDAHAGQILLSYRSNRPAGAPCGPLLLSRVRERHWTRRPVRGSLLTDDHVLTVSFS